MATRLTLRTFKHKKRKVSNVSTDTRTAIMVTKSGKGQKRAKNQCLGSIFSAGVCQRCVKRVCICSWSIKRVDFWNEYSMIRSYNFKISVLRVGSVGPCLLMTTYEYMVCLRPPPQVRYQYLHTTLWKKVLYK